MKNVKTVMVTDKTKNSTSLMKKSNVMIESRIHSKYTDEARTMPRREATTSDKPSTAVSTFGKANK